MPYILARFLSGGTFSPGADWKTQFEAATHFDALPTIGGAIAIPGSQTAYGVHLAFGLDSYNPFDSELLVLEASVGAPVQVYVNDELVQEVDVPGAVPISLLPGVNRIEIVRPQSPLVVIPAGPLLDPKGRTNVWTSLYAQGEDPFTNPTGTTLPTATYTHATGGIH